MITVYNARDVAAFLNVTPGAVGNWQTRHDNTPAPTHQSRHGSPLWDESGMAEWLQWHERHQEQSPRIASDLAMLRKKLMS